MGPTGVLERRSRVARLLAPRGGRRRRRLLQLARHALVVLAVVAASITGAYAALDTYDETSQLSVGQIELSANPGSHGALDLYVPLVDWGVRFEDTIRLPIRLNVDLRTVDRSVVAKVAQGGSLDLQDVRSEARDAIASYLRKLIGLALLGSLGLGLLVAFAVRHHSSPRLRYTTTAVGATTAAIAVALVVLFPPRGTFDEPQYYAFGPDIPRALDAVEAAQRSTEALDQELDAQLVGLARLVTNPAQLTPLADRPSITIASDLHNNFLAVNILDSATGENPLFFAGDLTDRGSPLEARLVSRVTTLGSRLVFVSGNHDSDSLQRDLARRGALVLTQRGSLKEDGTYGPVVNEIGGLKVAGYSDPFERRQSESFRDRFQPAPSAAQRDAFTAWLLRLIGEVDVVMVHQPALVEPALDVLEDEPPARPLVIITGHTHEASLDRRPGVTVVNGGSVGAGGTGNLGESTDYALARLIYTTEPAFQPLAADLITIDPGDGSSTASRERLESDPEPET
jgi:predicted phosphodiesterase